MSGSRDRSQSKKESAGTINVSWMSPPASFFGFFMAAILNLPEKPILEKLWVMLLFLAIVALEKVADRRQERLRNLYPLLKGGLCFFSFFLLSIVYMPNIVEHPLKLAGALIGGSIFSMAIYMPIRFQEEEKQKELADKGSEEQPQDR